MIEHFHFVAEHVYILLMLLLFPNPTYFSFYWWYFTERWSAPSPGRRPGPRAPDTPLEDIIYSCMTANDAGNSSVRCFAHLPLTSHWVIILFKPSMILLIPDVLVLPWTTSRELTRKLLRYISHRSNLSCLPPQGELFFFLFLLFILFFLYSKKHSKTRLWPGQSKASGVEGVLKMRLSRVKRI